MKLCTTLPVETRRVVMVIFSVDACPAGVPAVLTTVRYGLRINIAGCHSKERRRRRSACTPSANIIASIGQWSAISHSRQRTWLRDPSRLQAWALCDAPSSTAWHKTDDLAFAP